MKSIDHVLNTGRKGPICKLLKSGAPGEIRTPDLLLRRLSTTHRATQNHTVVVAPERQYRALSASIAHILHTKDSIRTTSAPRLNKKEED